MLFLVLLFPFSKSLPAVYKTPEDAYFQAVAEDNDTRIDLNSTLAEFDYADSDSFPEDEQVDPELVAAFVSWANAQPPMPPLPTWRPRLATDQDVTDNAFGAITRNCPRGCYRSRSGHCRPSYNYEEGTWTNQKRGVTCSVGGISPVSLALLCISITLILIN